MGSFNATCIVSNLAIEHGTPVRFQEGGWKEHRTFMRALLKIKGKWEEDNE